MAESKRTIRSVEERDAEWVREFITQRWGAEFVVAGGAIYLPHKLPGFIAIQSGENIGLITYRIEGDQCEIITLDSMQPGAGIGSALIDAVKKAAADAGCRRVWLITTNDNLNALRFYQKRGFVLAAVRCNAIDVSRQYKPIPATGEDGIPIRDEIELELILGT